MLSSMYTASVPAHCTPIAPYLERLSSAFNTCVPTPLALLSTALGICSLIAWLFAQVPQIYKNWRLESASGLSIYFLIEWMAGDIANGVGAVLTDQATWQLGIAGYYVIVDLCLTMQYFWYCHIRPWRWKRQEKAEWGPWRRQRPERERLLAGSPIEEAEVEGSEASSDGVLNIKPEKPRQSDTRNETERQAAEKSQARLVPRKASSSSSKSHPNALLGLSLATLATASALPAQPIDPVTIAANHKSATLIAGNIISWCSTLLYLCSRLPQIYKNTIRRSTAGLSPYMFLAAFTGNLFYSAAILTNPLAWADYEPFGCHGWVSKEGSRRMDFVRNAAPFWLGAAGVLVLDATVGLQFLAYGQGEEEKKVLIVEEVDDGDDEMEQRGRWHRVTGWMRGWVPSPSRRGVGTIGEGEQRPLIVERRGSGHTGRDYGST